MKGEKRKVWPRGTKCTSVEYQKSNGKFLLLFEAREEEENGFRQEKGGGQDIRPERTGIGAVEEGKRGYGEDDGRFRARGPLRGKKGGGRTGVRCSESQKRQKNKSSRGEKTPSQRASEAKQCMRLKAAGEEMKQDVQWEF